MHIRGVMLRVWGMRVGRGCMRDRTQLMSYVPGASMSQGTFGYRKRRFFFFFFFLGGRLTVSVLQSHFDGLLDLHFRPNR